MAENEEIRDIREEMRVAVFWRKLIGDMEYVKFDPEDMFRWYEALELRGPDEIRQAIDERYFTRQGGVMQGVVSRSPHPPLWLVHEWLEHADSQSHTLGYWAMAGCFLLLSGLCFSGLQGCVNLQPLSPLVMNPPAGTPPVATYALPSVAAPGDTTSAGQSAMQPRTAAAPAATPTVTGPSSNGIAGAATGQVPSAGVTGGQNIGVSAGVQTGGNQP